MTCHAFFEANTEFHQRFFEAADNRMLAELYRQLRGQIDRHRLRSLELRGDLRRSIAEHRAILSRPRSKGDVERAVHLTSEHIRVPQIKLLDEDQELASPDVKVEMSTKLEFGVNLNNREPLIAPDYDLEDAARPVRGRRVVRVRLGLGRRQPLLEAAV